MPDIDITTSGAGIPVQGPSGETVYVNPTPQGVSGQSTLSPSQSQQEQDAWDAQIPYLPPPGVSETLLLVDPLLITMQANTDLNKATMAMLDAWNDSIKKVKEDQDAALRDPDNIRRDEERRQVSGFVGNYLQTADPSTDAAIPYITIGLIIAGGSSGIVNTIMIDTASTSMVGNKPSLDQSVAAPQQYQNDMREWLSILGAALVQGMSYRATASAIGETDGTNPAAQNQLTAEQYADDVLALISSGNLNSIITSFVQSKNPDQPVNADYVKYLESQLEVFLLGTALAALYSAGKGGTGHMIAEDLQGLLNHTTDLTDNPNKEKIEQIVDQLNGLIRSLPSETATNLLISLYAFVDTNPASNVLKDPAKFFSSFQSLARDPEKG